MVRAEFADDRVGRGSPRTARFTVPAGLPMRDHTLHQRVALRVIPTGEHEKQPVCSEDHPSS